MLPSCRAFPLFHPSWEKNVQLKEAAGPSRNPQDENLQARAARSQHWCQALMAGESQPGAPVAVLIP
jgi:hypothetical protein